MKKSKINIGIIAAFVIIALFNQCRDANVVRESKVADAIKRAEENKQLIEWLKELKFARECIERIRIACLTLKGDSFKNDVVKTMTKYFYDTGKESEALNMQYQYLSRSQKSQYDDMELAKRILNTIDEYITDKKKE